MNNSLGAIILAAGKGTRMKSKNLNKVVMPLLDKPMILHTIELLEKTSVKEIVVVVGFAKESVMKLLGKKVIFANQAKRLGTAHAVGCGIKKMPKYVDNTLVLNGDDSAFYSKELILNLIKKHEESKAVFTFLTLDTNTPQGLGRVIRGAKNEVLAVIEEKDASEDQKKITEINPGCYLFKTEFLKKYLLMVKKSKITGEYYLTSLIDLGIKNGERIETVKAGHIAWRGVNTKEELIEAEKLLSK